MKTDKFKTYCLEILLIGIISILAIFQLKSITRTSIAIFLFVYALIAIILLTKRKTLSIYSNQVLIIMLFFSIIYLGVYYSTGIITGYYHAVVKFSPWAIKKFIIPLTIIIITTEIMRNLFLSQKIKHAKILTFILTVLIDILVFGGVYNLDKAEDFLSILGYVTFSSISCNMLYNYISSNYGSKPIIIYRLITTLYLYVIPITPDVYIFFRTIFKMVYPYIIYLTLDYAYSKERKPVIEQKSTGKVIGTTIAAILSILIVCLVSNKFKYGILVIATGSMTGTINRGDAIIFEQYNNKPLEVGTIIVFHKENKEIVHRIIEVKIENNEYHYYTKGDANMQNDDFYVIPDEIKGVTKLKITGLGKPTLWFRNLFE